MIDWYRRGLSVNDLLPTLSVYMGHVQLANTYWPIAPVSSRTQEHESNKESSAGKSSEEVIRVGLCR